MIDPNQEQQERRNDMLVAKALCAAACLAASGLALWVPFVGPRGTMNLVNYMFEAVLVLAAIGFAYAGVQLDKALPPGPAKEPKQLDPTAMNPFTAGDIFGFIWGSPP